MIRSAALVIALLALFAAAQTQPSTAPAPIAMGDAFESRAAGIGLAPPLGMVKQRRTGSIDNVVDFDDALRNWSLRVSRTMSPRPMSLIGRDDPATPLEDESRTRPGFTDRFIADVKRANANARISPLEDITVAGRPAVRLAIKFTQGVRSWYRLEVLLGNGAYAFYRVELTVPIADLDKGDDDKDIIEARAAMDAVIKTVRLFDLAEIRKDQDERLVRTRYILVTLSPKKLTDALVARSHSRINREGKDVGFTISTEKIITRDGQEGVLILSKAFSQGDKGQTSSVFCESFMATDRKREHWAQVSTVERDGDSSLSSEAGASNRRIVPKLVEEPGKPRKDNAQPVFREAELFSLTVSRSSRALGKEQIDRDLPPWYLHRAAATLLPRLLPRTEKKGYLFASWVPSMGEVMSHYVDIDPQVEVVLDGARITADAVREKIGIEGDVTSHYFLRSGKFLGTHVEADNTWILPGEEKAIKALFPNADTSDPKEPGKN